MSPTADADSETAIARARIDMMPLAVVLDTDVLHRGVDYRVRRGWLPSVLAAASPSYTLITGVVLFATTRVREELEHQLHEIAERRGVELDHITRIWVAEFLPRVRFVDLDEHAIADPRVAEVAARHDADAPTAALALLLAPCLVLTDNRRHFAPLGIAETPTNALSLQVHELGAYYSTANLTVVLPATAALTLAERSRALASGVGRDAALAIGLVLLAAAVVLWRSEPGGQLRVAARRLACELGPPLARAATRALVLTEQLAGAAIEPPAPADSALRLIARTLARRQTTLTTAAVLRRLDSHGYCFTGPQAHAVRTRRWLAGEPCFVEVRRGHWTLGTHPGALLADDRSAIAAEG